MLAVAATKAAVAAMKAAVLAMPMVEAVDSTYFAAC